jgi:hypothetical protein
MNLHFVHRDCQIKRSSKVDSLECEMRRVTRSDNFQAIVTSAAR